VAETLEAEIAALPKMNIDQLRAKWRRDLKQAPPLHVRKQLLVPLLAYKLQEQAFGGLRPEIKRRLRELGASINREPRKTGDPFTIAVRIKPGTRLIREWEGKTYQVTVGETSFEYNGQQYPSLSAIASFITGTHWSGPRFFGLRKRSS
jgi:Protein of unknown function (DUF2924)